MASLKDVQVKITGIKKTEQITKAMNMVSSAKLRGAQRKIFEFRPYAEKFLFMLNNVSGKIEGESHSLLSKRLLVKTVGIVLITADRGLCGSFNLNIINKALQIANSKKKEGKDVVFYCLGKKGLDAIRKLDFGLKLEMAGIIDNMEYSTAEKAGETVINSYISEEVDEIIMVYGQYISASRHEPSVMSLLPVSPDNSEESTSNLETEYIYEPSASVLLSELLPRYVYVQIFCGVLDTSASEHAARMAAMDTATKNCDEIITTLTLLFNKTRQAAITKDLMDIVGGVEALKG